MFNVTMETQDGDLRGYPIYRIIEAGIDLDQFDKSDWIYDPNFDLVFVRANTKIAVFLALHFADLRD